MRSQPLHLSLVLAMVLASGSMARAQFAEDIDLPSPTGKSTEPLPIDGRLLKAFEMKREGRSAAEIRARLELNRVKVRGGDQVQVEVNGVAGSVPLSAATFAQVGGERTRTWGSAAQAWVPVDQLRNLALSLPPGYEILSTAEQAMPASFAGNGPGFTRSGAYRDVGYDGSGIKIAVVDVGFRGLVESIDSGDAPWQIETVDFTGGGDFYLPGDTRHGRMCVETIFDHAPGAQYIAAKVSTGVEFGNAVNYFIQEGVDIISLSLVWGLTAWGDDQGTACAAATTAAQAGILLFTAAGNDGDKHWQGWSSDADADNWVEFSVGDEALGVLVEPGKTVEFSCKWDKTGNPDFDLYLFADTPGQWLATAANNGPLYEALSWKNTGDSNKLVRLAIHRGNNDYREIEVFGRESIWLEHQVYAGSTQSPSNTTHPNVISVGAVPGDKYGTASYAPQSIIASYSSRGRSNDGMLLPDLCAPTSTNGSFFEVFTGTSCATPNAAGTAACLWSTNPAATAGQVRGLLFQWAEDKDWYQPGPDVNYGIGGINFPVFDDCNQNGLADAFDVINGAADVNQNHIPDVCENPGYGFSITQPAPIPDDEGVPTVIGVYTTPGPGGFPPPSVGFSLGIAHDPAVFAGVDVQVGPDLGGLNGGLGPELFLVQVLPQGFTLQVSYGMDPTGGPLELPIVAGEDVALLTYFVQAGVGSGTPPTSLAFSDTLGTAAPVPNQVLTATGPALLVNLPGVTTIQFSDHRPFLFSLPDEVALYDPADGVVTVTGMAAIAEDLGGNALPEHLDGFTMRVEHQSPVLSPVLVTPAPLLAALNGGLGPDFFGITLQPGSVVAQVVYGPGETLSHELGLGVVQITYQGEAGLLTGDLDGVDVHLVFADGAVPGSGNQVLVAGTSQAPETKDGWIALVPSSPGTPFQRGDCNSDGAYDIGDPITMLGFLFPGAALPGPPDCDDACDCNDDEMLDIADAICMLSGLFGVLTVPPPAPHPGCGLDPSSGALGCAASGTCP